MKESKLLKVQQAIKDFVSMGYEVTEHANGHLRINGWNYWATTEKFYNPVTGDTGCGYVNFMEVLSREVI
ncbi:MAG: hypothetical protein R3Y58_01985 [Eubacteriales bacterium]